MRSSRRLGRRVRGRLRQLTCENRLVRGSIGVRLRAAILIGLWLPWLATAQSNASDATYQMYSGKDISFPEAQKKLQGKPICVKDIFGEAVRRLPRGLSRRGITRRKYIAFRTAPEYGSDMLCVVPKAAKESVRAIQATLAGGKILMWGKVRFRLGLTYVFVCDRVILSWIVPPTPAIKTPRPVTVADLLWFRAGFDGNLMATLNGREHKPRASLAGKYEPSDHSRALDVRHGIRPHYELAEGFPYNEGSLEFRFRPDFPQDKKQPDRSVLKIAGAAKSSITLRFRRSDYAWEFLLKTRSGARRLRIPYGRVTRGKWHHLLLVWNRHARPKPRIDLYHNGLKKQSAKYSVDLRGLTFLEIGASGPSVVSVDEVALYNRAFTPSQAAFASGSFGLGEKRLSSLAQLLTKDDLKKQRD